MPGSNESKHMVLWRKLALTGLGVLCPEIMTTTAVGQWVRARRCVRKFNSDELEQERNKRQKLQHAEGAEKPPADNDSQKEVWTMEMAFFADMGGFRLRTKNQDSFPLDAQQLFFLVKEGYVKQPIFRPKLIDDKNKVDVLLRTILLCQISWFLIGVIGRWAQRLFVTTAELTTVSFILCSAVTFAIWWHKPADVVMAEHLEIDKDVHEILRDAGIPEEKWDEWRMTPLDFVSREEWWWSKAWWNFLNILRKMHFKFGSEGRPSDRIPDSSQYPLGGKERYTILVMTTVCFSVFFTAWNHDFPTWYEMVLWRASSISLMFMLYVCLAISEILRVWNGIQRRTESWKQRRSPATVPQSPRPGTKRSPFSNCRTYRRIAEAVSAVDKALNRVRNNSPDDDRNLYIPLRVIVPLYVLGFLYSSCRGYIMIADIIELRSLPPSAYQSVDWQKFWPHLG
ncbi:MAG: hypothetical protein LQ338_002772 [Usnochroma carphineum]|nr:MAG: hypothetical protein LQ338_002772 [Usnochroma carphineum]